MDYRDEREALRGRVDNLEQDLADARKEAASREGDDWRQRIADLERQMADARRVLEQLGAELDAIKGTRRAPAAAFPVGLTTALGAIAVLAISVVFILQLRTVGRPRVEPRPTPRQVLLPPAPAPEVQAPPTSSPELPAPARRVKATWTGKVTRATGLPLAPGTPCTVEAALDRGRDVVSVTELTLACGGRSLFRSGDALEGMSMTRVLSTEMHTPAGDVYTLAFDDKGARTGTRNEISLDTTAKQGTVWRDSVPAFRVDFAVAERSAPVPAEAPRGPGP